MEVLPYSVHTYVRTRALKVLRTSPPLTTFNCDVDSFNEDIRTIRDESRDISS